VQPRAKQMTPEFLLSVKFTNVSIIALLSHVHQDTQPFIKMWDSGFLPSVQEGRRETTMQLWCLSSWRGRRREATRRRGRGSSLPVTYHKQVTAMMPCMCHSKCSITLPKLRDGLTRLRFFLVREMLRDGVRLRSSSKTSFLTLPSSDFFPSTALDFCVLSCLLLCLLLCLRSSQKPKAALLSREFSTISLGFGAGASRPKLPVNSSRKGGHYGYPRILTIPFEESKPSVFRGRHPLLQIPMLRARVRPQTD
jgi:hypothetical protein